MTPLEESLLVDIREKGPIGFDEFMEAALYHPELGFYARGGRGPGTDFVTSPELSPLFGAMLAQAVQLCHQAIDEPVPFVLCEVGAGRGALIADLLGAAADSGAAWVGALEVVLVDRCVPAKRADAPAGFRLARDLSEVEPFQGIVLANELLDNLPVRLLAGQEEVRVGERDGRLELVPKASDYRVDPVGIRAFLDQVDRVLLRGYVVLIDYGARGGGVRTFAGHRLGEEILEEPGERDVTASVDFDLVASEAVARGLDVLGRQSQRDLLLCLGLGSSLKSLREAELAAARAQDIWESLRMRDRWTRAGALIDPEGPGGFEVLTLGRGVPAHMPWESAS